MLQNSPVAVVLRDKSALQAKIARHLLHLRFVVLKLCFGLRQVSLYAADIGFYSEKSG